MSAIMEQGKCKKVGILGGTFDPIHMGHLILAETAYDSFGLDYVMIMPNGNPPHKPGCVNASMEQRIHMAKLAVADNPHLVVSDFEKNQTTFHYTYETLELLKEENPGTEYYFILGGDSLAQFHTWKEPQRICNQCCIIAAVRDQMDIEVLHKNMIALRETYHARIEAMETPIIDIASHTIREKTEQKRSIRYLVPDSVESYIREQGLYTNL